eukprot:14244612-Alexandrium_andersonii.AAC.1
MAATENRWWLLTPSPIRCTGVPAWQRWCVMCGRLNVHSQQVGCGGLSCGHGVACAIVMFVCQNLSCGHDWQSDRCRTSDTCQIGSDRCPSINLTAI